MQEDGDDPIASSNALSGHRAAHELHNSTATALSSGSTHSGCDSGNAATQAVAENATEVKECSSSTHSGDACINKQRNAQRSAAAINSTCLSNGDTSSGPSLHQGASNNSAQDCSKTTTSLSLSRDDNNVTSSATEDSLDFVNSSSRGTAINGSAASPVHDDSKSAVAGNTATGNDGTVARRSVNGVACAAVPKLLMNSVRSNNKSYHFAESFLRDANRQVEVVVAAKEKQLKQAVDTRLQILTEKAKAGPRTNPTTDTTVGAVVADGSAAAPADSACDVHSPHTAGTNYERWSALAQSIRLEDDITRLEEEAAAEAKRREVAAIGCSHDHTKERLVYEKTTEEKLNASNRFRLEGNSAFREKNYGLASVNYRKGLLQLDYCFPDSDEARERYETVKLSCHLNLAACKIHQRDWDECLSQCRLALELDSKNAKALYRRGMAYLHLDNFDNAEKALQSAELSDPTSTAVQQAKRSLAVKRAQYLRRNKTVCTAMFGGGKASTREQQQTVGNQSSAKGSEYPQYVKPMKNGGLTGHGFRTGRCIRTPISELECDIGKEELNDVCRLTPQTSAATASGAASATSGTGPTGYEVMSDGLSGDDFADICADRRHPTIVQPAATADVNMNTATDSSCRRIHSNPNGYKHRTARQSRATASNGNSGVGPREGPEDNILEDTGSSSTAAYYDQSDTSLDNFVKAARNNNGHAAGHQATTALPRPTANKRDRKTHTPVTTLYTPRKFTTTTKRSANHSPMVSPRHHHHKDMAAVTHKFKELFRVHSAELLQNKSKIRSAEDLQVPIRESSSMSLKIVDRSRARKAYSPERGQFSNALHDSRKQLRKKFGRQNISPPAEGDSTSTSQIGGIKKSDSTSDVLAVLAKLTKLLDHHRPHTKKDARHAKKGSTPTAAGDAGCVWDGGAHGPAYDDEFGVDGVVSWIMGGCAVAVVIAIVVALSVVAGWGIHKDTDTTPGGSGNVLLTGVVDKGGGMVSDMLGATKDWLDSEDPFWNNTTATTFYVGFTVISFLCVLVTGIC